MSLKAFHIVFIFTAILSAFGFGVWLLLVNGGAWNVVAAVAAFLTGIALVLYEWRFLKKFRHISNM